MNVLLLTVFLIGFSKAQINNSDSLSSIRAFQEIDMHLASSGFVEPGQLHLLKKAGFTHIINLILGYFSWEDSIASSIGITFSQIPVEWKNPAIANVDSFFSDLSANIDGKVLVHCQANMRASAFVYLFRTLKQNIPESKARQKLFEIWTPDGKWKDLLVEVKSKYQN